MVKELLKKGIKNTLSTDDLCYILDLSPRELQKKIAEEREAGAVIISTSKGHGGYYLPENRKDIEKFIAALSKRAGNTFKALKSAKELLKCIDENGAKQ